MTETCSKFSSGSSLPIIYVMSQIPGIAEYLGGKVPSGVVVRALQLPGEFSRDLELSVEDFQFVIDAEILLCDATILAKIMRQLLKLKWAHCTWAGVDNIISSARKSAFVPEFVLTRHGGLAFSSLMGEYVICQILNWERHMKEMWSSQENKIWHHPDRFESYRALSDVVVCILGVGNMGCGVARCLKMFGATVLGLSRSQKSRSSEIYSYFDIISTDMAEVFPKCDYLCNTLPNTEETQNLLTEHILSICTKKPVFINVGRGSIIREKSLILALRNEWLSGAILDVFEQEPLPESSALWQMPQVVITPHIASVSKAEHIVEEFLKNYKRYISGDALQYKVDWYTGY